MTRRGVKPLRLSLGAVSDDDEPETQDTTEAKAGPKTAASRPRIAISTGLPGTTASSSSSSSSSVPGAASLRTRTPGGALEVDLQQLRQTVQGSLTSNMHENAIFFASKLVTLSGAQPRDVLLLAQAYYRAKQYRRAVHLIQTHGFLQTQQENMQPAGVTRMAAGGGLAAKSNRSAHSNPLAALAAKLAADDNRGNIAGGPGVGTRRQSNNSRSSAPRKSSQDVLIDANVEFIVLAVQCLVGSGQHEEAQSVLEQVLGDMNLDRLRSRAKRVLEMTAAGETSTAPRPAQSTQKDSQTGQRGTGQVNPIAMLCLLRGRVYETLDNRPRASKWFKAALVCDIYCYEAFDALVDSQLRPVEERQLMSELHRYRAFEDDAAWLFAVYSSRLSKHDFSQPVAARFKRLDKVVAAPDPVTPLVDTRRHNLGNDLDCAADRAECVFQQHDALGAYQLTSKIRAQDPFHLRCIKVHLAALVELKRKSELFHTAHQLVDAYPSLAVSWFAVACYYYCIGKYEAARRFFHKATAMDPSMAEAWIGFGHAFAAQDESDQAMAAYRTSSRLFAGCHLPVLCTAIEYLRTNNVPLAEQFCRQAKSMCATDPLVFNELGVVHFRQGRLKEAVDCFKQGLSLCKSQPERLRHAWEPVMFNLGHAYRRMRRFDDAIRYYEEALSYNPKEASIYSALGITYHLQNRLDDAIQSYHSALGLKPEDTFASEMLDKALTEVYALPGHVPAISYEIKPIEAPPSSDMRPRSRRMPRPMDI
ncbi:Anaphase-promoting complex subunit 6 [Hondaea fermentalgiana]|uniref:Anaphase-promoting complex subunit 6 n=1 Tax=Hondaea fermentalgiana TaxID=2315210 RepID=A0A2R5GPS9_9STRA|nr:Anaphase-promoting complex subunit 6 [Hondaea fermentalgiana]|eukprot:GBG32886.1 Anaphase-promoting complex subunit 6 [Hondaea fermentalgiana]